MTTSHTPLSAPTRAAMDEVGGMTVAGILGLYQHNLDERARLLAEPKSLESALALWRVEQRVFLYRMLEREAGRPIGTGEEA